MMLCYIFVTETCLPGYFSKTGYEPCTPCHIGTYQSNSESTECLSCPNGYSTITVESYDSSQCRGRIKNPIIK